MKPVNVRIHRMDTDETIYPEVVFDGFDEDGLEMWMIVGVTIRPHVDHILADTLFENTSLGFTPYRQEWPPLK